MEKKRKLPARASARVENANKRRNLTPRERSETPVAPQPVVEEPLPPPPPPPPPQPQPKSIEAGKPLPTVDDAQPEHLSAKDYQSVSESGVLAESLSRSRHRWISDGLFEKYWTKPHKRKGVVNEDPKNPPKDSMTKVGTVTITIEPHIIEATMFVVKESKLRPPPPPPKPQAQAQPQQTPVRPILQYGPPNGSMPPPPTPTPTTATPSTPGATSRPVAAPSPSQNSLQTSPGPPQHQPATTTTEAHKSSVAPLPASNPSPSLSPSFTGRSAAPTLAAPSAALPPPARPPSNPHTAQQQPAPTPLARPAPPPTISAPPISATTARPLVSAAPSQSPAMAAKPPNPAPGHPPAPATKPAPNDPVIALLAQKASGDPELRDLMKRVAVGQAKDGELAHFQKIIDQLNAEYRRSGGQQGPSADRLLVDGRTVKYFADEVRTILDIVLQSNPNQKSTDLRPPPQCDPLVVLLVKTALEDQRTKDMIKRIAEGRPGFTDATDLKDILDRLHRDAKTVPRGLPASPPAKNPPPNGPPNGHAKATPPPVQPHNTQALRSKGPPPVPKPDISAVVFDFGSGDRYLFPKFSILEYLPVHPGQEVVASFLIVRKGSISEYGGDPKLDYYQPVTIRLSTPGGRHLENLARAVAPQDEVRRYMDDVMDNMTRAEYVLLAMRLPRASKDGGKEDVAADEPKTNGAAPKDEPEPGKNTDARSSVLWTTSVVNPAKQWEPTKARNAEEENDAKYRRLIQSVAAKGS